MDKKPIAAYLALAVVCFVWGTTYFAMRVGVATFPPLTFSGIRHTLAGSVMLAFLLLSKRLKLNMGWQSFRRQFLPGLLMIAIGNGVVGWSERYIPSGLAALILSVTPVYIVLINLMASSEKERPNVWIWAGLGLGSLGVGLIFRDNLKDLSNPAYFNGMMLAFLACMAWALGNVSVKRRASSGEPLVNAAFQLLAGGLVLLFAGLLWDDLAELRTVSRESMVAMVYLIIVGSILAYSCFVYALAHLPVGLVSVYAYVNPVVALFLGAVFLSEPVTGMTLAALLCILGGTFFIARGYRPASKSGGLASET